jgi:hypothetical protein
MIQSPEDLASVFAAVVRPDTAGEAEATTPRTYTFMSPPRAVFHVRTVEGRTFRVTIDEEVGT